MPHTTAVAPTCHLSARETVIPKDFLTRTHDDDTKNRDALARCDRAPCVVVVLIRMKKCSCETRSVVLRNEGRVGGVTHRVAMPEPRLASLLAPPVFGDFWLHTRISLCPR